MRAEPWTAGLAIVLLATALAGCRGGDSAAVDADEANLTRREVLGKHLFFDTSLSTPPGQSCASCHDAEKAFSGNNGSSTGVALGADGRSLGLRNTPSAMYARFAPPFALVDDGGGPIPVGGQFLDGRAASLEDQAGQPFFTADEMNVESPAALVARVSQADYADRFREEWGPGIFDDTAAAMEAITTSIAAFERTARFAPFSSKYDHVVNGRARFTDDEQRGLDLFLDPEKGNCAGCHVADPASSNLADSLFTDFTYDNLGVPRNARIPASIPIVSWLKENAEESLAHAHRAGELVTLLGGHPSLKIGPLLETEKHDIGDILRESMEHEKSALSAYYELLRLAEGQSVLLEEYARDMIVSEEQHLDEVDKMLRRPGAIERFGR